jgi:uncharacterized repeat protein (TIGR01451 family)
VRHIKSLTILVSILIFSWDSFSQTNPKWLNFAPAYIVTSIAFEGNVAWVGTYGSGIIRIDTLTGQRIIYNGANSGIANNSIQTILVDQAGNKWIGYNQGIGISKFDGTSWTNFQQLSNNRYIYGINKIKEGKNGAVFFLGGVSDTGFYNGTQMLLKYDGSIVSEVTTTEGASCFDLDTLGNPCIAKNASIAWYNGNTWTVYDTTNTTLVFNSVEDLNIDDDNELWFSARYYANSQTTYKALHLKNSVWYSHSLGLVQPVLQEVFKDTTGKWFYALYSYKVRKVYETASFQYINKPSTNSVLVGMNKAGKLWFGDFTSDGCILYELNVPGWKNIKFTDDPTYYPYYYSVANDKLGNKWIASWGLTKFDGFNWTTYRTTNSGIPSDDVQTVFVDHSNTIWITYGSSSTNALNVASFNGVNWTTYSLPLLNGISVQKIVEDSSGNLWMSTMLDGLLKYNGSNWTFFNSQNSSLTNDHILGMYIDKNGKLWLTPYSQGLVSFDGTNWAIYNTNNSPLNSNYINLLGVDATNSVWILDADASGVNLFLKRFDGTNWTTYFHPRALGMATSKQNTCDANGNLWMGFVSSVIKFDGTSLTPYTFYNSGVCGYVQAITSDDQNRVWFATMGGLSVYDDNGITFDELHNIPLTTAVGNVFYDNNGNGIKDLGTDPGLNHHKVKLAPGNDYTFTDAFGNYKFYCRPDLYKSIYQVKPNWLLTSDSAFYTFTLDSIPQNGFDFGTQPNLQYDGGEVQLNAGSPRCASPSSLWLNCRNIGTTFLNGQVCLIPDSALSFNSYYPPVDSINGDTLIWNFNNLAPGEEKYIHLVVQNPPINFNSNNLMFNTALLRYGQSNFIMDTLSTRLRCSFDPNEKSVQPEGITNQHMTLMSETLEYAVHFENTGNDTAFTVMVIDTLDVNLDWSTFDVVASSHPVTTFIDTNGVVKFRFDQINLLWRSQHPAFCDGFVSYRIKPKSGLPSGTVIKNRASIYFDYNLAIKTNVVFNTMVYVLGTESIGLNSAIKIYPNPADDKVLIKLAEGISSGTIQILNILGKVVYQHSFQSNSIVLDTKNFQPGMYFIVLKEGNREMKSKFCILH